jgi:hypothetical protein
MDDMHAGSIMALLVIAFLGGILTIISPCILPVLPFVFSRADQPFRRSGLPLLAGMFFLKDDTHTEHGIFPGISPFPLIEPVLRDADIQTSIGVQDVVRILPNLSVTGGFSADHFDGLQGQQYNSAMTALLPLNLRYHF